MNVLAYHGSFTDFDEFSFNKVGTASGTSGAGYGLYFSESKADALGYGDIVYTCFLQLKNNLSNEKVTLTPTLLKSIFSTLINDYDKSYYQQFGYENPSEATKNKIINEELKTSKSDTDLIGGIINGLFGGNCKQMLKVLTKF